MITFIYNTIIKFFLNYLNYYRPCFFIFNCKIYSSGTEFLRSLQGRRSFQNTPFGNRVLGKKSIEESYLPIIANFYVLEDSHHVFCNKVLEDNSSFLNEYLYISIYLFIASILAFTILAFSYLLALQNPETEKMSAYECGFEPYEDARLKFDVAFYIPAMLLIIFDIEIMFLIPWSVSLSTINSVGYWIMVDFVFELSIGFAYVWCIGGLDWNKGS